MRKIFIYILSFLFLVFTDSKTVNAIVDPLAFPNNKFGIHISNEDDLEDASQLVNSSGGDFGYVTIVITEQERDREKWQRIFDKMRRLRLIPLIRIASNPQSDGTWKKPKSEEINNWIAFLNSLNWVTKNRYVIIYNEPNHAKEWGGELDPSGYASFLKEFSQKLKSANPDFYILPAGFDASAPNSKITMNEELFIKKMLEKEGDIFSHIDGWVSHSYPNPDFSGSETDKGRGSIATFDWELSLLKENGVDKTLPIFITETGWKHNTNNSKSVYLDETEVEKKFIYAFKNVWSDKRIVAVTPFIINYPEAPFNNFSWKKTDDSFYSFFNSLVKVPKVAGEPKQDNMGILLAIFAPPIHRGGSTFSGSALVRNTGQTIWVNQNISLKETNNKISIVSSEFYNVIEPFNYGMISFRALTPINNGLYGVKFALTQKGEVLSNTFPYEIISIGTNEMQSESFFDDIFSKLKVWASNYF